MKKNIFLTGQIRIGKSTVIKKIISDSFFRDLTIKGFRTIPEFKNDGYALESIDGIRKQFMNWDSSSTSEKFDSRNFDLSVFEGLGVASLTEAMDKADIILMDEIGIVEERAENFKKIVLQCINSRIMVLGVIQERARWFLELIGTRNDTSIFKISRNNREDIHEEILKLIKNQ